MAAGAGQGLRHLRTGERGPLGQMRCLWIQLTGAYYEKYITKHNFY